MFGQTASLKSIKQNSLALPHCYNSKTQSFHYKIRQKHIQLYKQAVRDQTILIINYSNPEESVCKIQHAIMMGFINLEKIMNVVLEIMEQYCFCEFIARKRIVQKILVAIDLKNNKCKDVYAELIEKWLQIVEKGLFGWAHLWQEMYNNIGSILLALAMDNNNQSNVVGKIAEILSKMKTKITITLRIQQKDIQILLQNQQKSCLKLLLQVIDYFSIKSNQNIPNLIIKYIHYIQNKQLANFYLRLLAKLEFIQQDILRFLHENLNHLGTSQKILNIQILYEQMYYTDEQLLEMTKTYPELQLFIKQLIDNDF